MGVYTQMDIKKVYSTLQGLRKIVGGTEIEKKVIVKTWKIVYKSSPPVLRAAESISLHFTRTESEVLGARGKEGMKEFEGALPSSFLLVELLLELLKKGKRKLLLMVFPPLQITLFQGKTQVFCDIHLMVFQTKRTQASLLKLLIALASIQL